MLLVYIYLSILAVFTHRFFFENVYVNKIKQSYFIHIALRSGEGFIALKICSIKVYNSFVKNNFRQYHKLKAMSAMKTNYHFYRLDTASEIVIYSKL